MYEPVSLFDSDSDGANAANWLPFFVGVIRAGCARVALVILSMRPWPIEYRYIYLDSYIKDKTCRIT